MKYNFTSGIRPHTGKYHIYRGTMPQTDMNRLAAVIAVVLAVTVAAFGFALNNVPEAPNFPPASVSSGNSSQPGGQSAAGVSGMPGGDSDDASSSQSGGSPNTSPVFRPLAQRQSSNSTPGVPIAATPSSAPVYVAPETTSVGGRGGGTVQNTDSPADTPCGCINNALDAVTNTVTETAPVVLP